MDSVIHIGHDKQLFLDQTLCDHSENICMVMNPPSSTGEVILEPTPEERNLDLSFGYYSSIRREHGRTRLWYFANNRKDVSGRRVCYAESEDGVHFSRPELDARFNGGLKPGNAVQVDPIQGSCVWVDPLAPPHQRYRTQAKWGPPAKFPGKGSSLHFYASPDGLDWKETHYLHIGDCDTQTVVFYDETLGRYAMYTREWVRFDDRNLSHRKVRRLESDDLVQWDQDRVVWEADAADLARGQTSVGKPPVDIYGACVFKYPEAGDFYVMLAQHFWHWQDRLEEEKWGYSPDPENMDRRIVHLGPAVIDVRLGYSRDGLHFHRAVERGPFLAVGPSGRYDSRGVWVLPDPVIREKDIWFYYVGGNRDHDGFIDPAACGHLSGIGRAVMRLDGFVSADADAQGGWLQTPLLRFPAGDLELNVAASAGGAARVEVLDPEMRPIPGFSGAESPWICEDSVRLPMRWGGGRAGELADRPVRVKFHLREAKLYSFQVVSSSG